MIVDEAWLLMKEPEGAKFLFRMAKAARKHWAGLAVITQDAADLLGSELGQAVVANAATQILLRQAPQAIDAVAAAFRLSAGERAIPAVRRPRPRLDHPQCFRTSSVSSSRIADGERVLHHRIPPSSPPWPDHEDRSEP